MENVEIARALDEVADLLDIQGANPFRVRAYRTAVRTIGNLARPVGEMVAEGADLRELPGIGEDIAGYIVEMVETGRLERLEALRREVPRSLVELLRVEGLGPKRAKLLYDQLAVRTLADLEKALDSGELQQLKGFGEKSAENIRQGLESLRRRPGRFKLCDADQLVRPLLAWMREAPGVERLEAAGSYRRRAETVGDIDLLAIASRAAPVMRRFTSYPDVARVESAGGTRGTVVLKAGLQVDLRILPRRCYGSALHYFTGSKAHNIAVRGLGAERGLRISEYGVFRLPRGGRGGAGAAADGRRSVTAPHGPGAGPSPRNPSASTGKPRRIGGAEEEDVFRAVGMAWVPPELRESQGEVEAALEDRLPELVRSEDIRGDLQMHSTWSDGDESIETMALAAAERGYAYIAMTDHSRAVTVAGGMDVEKLEAQWKEIAAVRRRLHGRIRLLRGMEVDILRDGTLDLPDDHLARLDIVVVSVHSHMKLSRAAMTERVIRAISHPAVHILAHPTGRLINERDAYDLDLEGVLRAAAEHGVAVEINAQPDRLDLDAVHARRAKELGVKLVIDTDAHNTAGLDFMRYGVDQARRAWLERGDVLNTMSLEELEAWLARKHVGAPRRLPAIRPAVRSRHRRLLASV